MTKDLPREITSHDLLKSLAIVLMIVDHLGYYFFPHYTWLRVAGRFSAPIWFFLIGYSDKRTVQNGIWAGGAILTLCWIVTGQYLLPMNILFMLGLARLLVDGIMRRALRTSETFQGVFLILFFLALPSMLVFEYGTLGLMFTMLGFMARHGDEIALPAWRRRGFIAATAVSYAGYTILINIAMTHEQALALLAGMILLAGLLWRFKAGVFPRLTRRLGPLAGFVRLMGRRSLEIYVLHLLVFSGLAAAFDPGRFGLFAVKAAPASLLRFFT